MKIVSLLFAILLTSGAAHAKCATTDIAFTGKVIDPNGLPAAQVTVALAWEEYDGITGPVTAMTNARGEYSLTVPFNTYSGKGKIVEDECNLRLKIVAVSASRANLETPYYHFRTGTLTRVRLPVLELFPRSSSFIRLTRPTGG